MEVKRLFSLGLVFVLLWTWSPPPSPAVSLTSSSSQFELSNQTIQLFKKLTEDPKKTRNAYEVLRRYYNQQYGYQPIRPKSNNRFLNQFLPEVSSASEETLIMDSDNPMKMLMSKAIKNNDLVTFHLIRNSPQPPTLSVPTTKSSSTLNPNPLSIAGLAIPGVQEVDLCMLGLLGASAIYSSAVTYCRAKGLTLPGDLSFAEVEEATSYYRYIFGGIPQMSQIWNNQTSEGYQQMIFLFQLALMQTAGDVKEKTPDLADMTPGEINDMINNLIGTGGGGPPSSPPDDDGPRRGGGGNDNNDKNISWKKFGEDCFNTYRGKRPFGDLTSGVGFTKEIICHLTTFYSLAVVLLLVVTTKKVFENINSKGTIFELPKPPQPRIKEQFNY